MAFKVQRNVKKRFEKICLKKKHVAVLLITVKVL